MRMPHNAINASLKFTKILVANVKFSEHSRSQICNCCGIESFSKALAHGAGPAEAQKRLKTLQVCYIFLKLIILNQK